MTQPDPDKVMVVPKSDPIYQTYIWRQDSITLARLRPVLMRLQSIGDQPCFMGPEPYACQTNEHVTCMACAIRQIKFELFGRAAAATKEQPDD